jgi:hypothetical protein
MAAGRVEHEAFRLLGVDEQERVPAASKIILRILSFPF